MNASIAATKPFVLSPSTPLGTDLSKGERPLWFDKLTTNGLDCGVES